jgi:heme exporter protein B
MSREEATRPRDSGGEAARAGVLAQAWLIARKDLTIELRTREIVTTAGFFAALVAILTSVAFAGGAQATERVAPGALWVSVAFSSILALGRTWGRERDDGALVGLLVTPLSRSALFLGKAAGVFAFVTAVELIVVPIVALIFHVELPDVAGPLALILVLGTIGVAANGTVFGAMTVRTRARDLLLATVLFPLLTPALLAGVAGTRELMAGAKLADLGDYLLLLLAFDAVGLVLGTMLFGMLIDD